MSAPEADEQGRASFQRQGPASRSSVSRAASASARRIIVARVAALAFTFVGSIVLARVLGPESRGAHGFFVAVTTLLGTILQFSGPIGGYILLTHTPTLSKRLAANGTWFALAAGPVASLAIARADALFGVLPAPLRAEPTWAVWLAVSVAGFVVIAYQLQVALALGHALAGAAISFGSYAVAAGGYVLLLPLWGAHLELAIAIFAGAPWLVAVAARICGIVPVLVPRNRPDGEVAGLALRAGSRMYPGDLATLVHQRADVILLGASAPAAALGSYVVAYQTAEPILVLASASQASILALGRGDLDVEGGTVTTKLIRDTVILSGGLAILAAAFGPLLIPLVYGTVYQASAGPFLLLLPAVVALSIGRIAQSDLTRRGMLGRTAIIAMISAAGNVALNLTLIPQFGAMGAASASLTTYALYALLSVGALHHVAGFAWRTLAPTRADALEMIAAWRPHRLGASIGQTTPR